MNRRQTCSAFLATLVFVILVGVNPGAARPASAASVTASHDTSAGYLTIKRLPNVGGGITAYISIDGMSLARLGWGQSYNGSLPPGDHLLSITWYPNFLFPGPSKQRLSIESGQSYKLTLKWKGDRLVLM